MRGGTDRPDTLGVHDHGTVNSNKSGRVKASGNLLHCDLHEIGPSPSVQLHVVFCCLQPVHVLCVHKPCVQGASHRDPIQILCLARDPAENRGQLRVHSLRSVVNSNFCSLQSLAESLRRKWLQQIVGGVQLEGL